MVHAIDCDMGADCTCRPRPARLAPQGPYCVLCSKPLTRRWPWLWMGGQPAHLTCIRRLRPSFELISEIARKVYSAQLVASTFLAAPLFKRLRGRRHARVGGKHIVVPLSFVDVKPKGWLT